MSQNGEADRPASDKVVVITGASGGIGAALGRLLAGRGTSVVLVARRKDALDDVALHCGGRALVVVADVSEREAVRDVVAAALDSLGRIDVWVNNVGRGISRMPTELTDDDVQQMIRLNVLTTLYGIQEILPHFKARGEGHIVNVSSMLGRVPFAAFRSAYSGAKHFVNALTATLRDELRESWPEIRVSLVSPGVVRTDFGLNALHGGPDSRDLPFSQGPEEVAEVIADVIGSRALDTYTREGSRQRVLDYYSSLGSDPSSR
jgi:NADP-dependent 3-hydroxy acid dehydrogenase YdfG